MVADGVARRARQQPQQRLAPRRVHAQREQPALECEREQLACSPSPKSNGKDKPFRSAPKLATPLKAADIRAVKIVRIAVKKVHETVVSRKAKASSKRTSTSRKGRGRSPLRPAKKGKK